MRPALLCTAAVLCANMVRAEGKAVPDQRAGISTPVQTVERVKQTVRLALLHGVPDKWNLQANFEVFLRMLDKAVADRADILITPECWLDGYAAADKTSTPERLKQIAQDPRDSRYLARVADEAKQHSLHLCFGFTSLENGKIYNAAGLWDASGRLIGVYHKAHLQKHDLQFAPGDALPVWPTVWGPVGIMICADRRWPETARTLRLQGARLILNPTYGFKGDLNEAMMRTRAYENQCFIAFAHPEVSLVTGPDGKVVAKEETGQPGVLMCDLDLENARDDNHLRDRRPELYGPITERKPGAGNANSGGSTLRKPDATP
jgi:predicted amidohydrolase